MGFGGMWNGVVERWNGGMAWLDDRMTTLYCFAAVCHCTCALWRYSQFHLHSNIACLRVAMCGLFATINLSPRTHSTECVVALSHSTPYLPVKICR